LEKEGQWGDHETEGNIIQRDAANLLRIRNRKAAARNEEWRRKVGEVMARKRAEVP
jgi:hypothetical protein